VTGRCDAQLFNNLNLSIQHVLVICQGGVGRVATETPPARASAAGRPGRQVGAGLDVPHAVGLVGDDGLCAPRLALPERSTPAQRASLIYEAPGLLAAWGYRLGPAAGGASRISLAGAWMDPIVVQANAGLRWRHVPSVARSTTKNSAHPAS
jgi:hypothetical protein